MKRLLAICAALLLPAAAFATVTPTIAKSGPTAIAGLPQVIPVGFPFQAGSNLLVLDTGTAGTGHDPAVVLSLGSDYTVTGGGYNAANQMQTGSINVVSTGMNSVQSGDYITVMRAVPVNQVSSFTATGPLTVQLLEQMGDKLATLSQQVNEIGGRSLQFENFESLSPVLNLAQRKNNYLGFDANGNIALLAATTGGGGGLTPIVAYSVLGNSTSGSILPVGIQSLILGTPVYAATFAGEQQTGAAAGSYKQILQNTSSAAAASADYVVQNNLGTGSAYFGDFGMNSSAYTGTGNLAKANAVKLTATTGDLSIGTTGGTAVHILANGSATDAITISGANVLSFPAGINSSSIGATTPSTGAFTTLSASGATTLAALTGSGAALFNSSVQQTSAYPSFIYRDTGGTATITNGGLMRQSGGGNGTWYMQMNTAAGGDFSVVNTIAQWTTNGLNTVNIGATTPGTGSFTTLSANNGVTVSGSAAIDFSGSSGAFKTSTGALTLGPGIATFTSTTDSSSISTGAVIVNGGVGIAKKLFVGTNLNVAGTATITGASTLTGHVGIGTAPPTVNGVITIQAVQAATTASPCLLIQGALTPSGGVDLHPNAFRDTTVFTANSAADAYASYDCNATLNGTVALNHYYGYQARQSYGGSNTLDVFAGYTMASSVTAGTVTEMRSFYVPTQSVSGGTVTHFAGLFMDSLGTFATTTDAIYCSGPDRWFSAGGQIITSATLAPPAGATTARGVFTFNQTSQTGMAVMNSNGTATGTLVSFCNSGGTVQGSITQTNSTTTAYNTSSDKRLKENFRPMLDSGKIIDGIQPVIFDWKWGGKNFHGMVAQDLNKVYPEAVTKTDDGKGELKGNPWSVDYSKLVPVLVAQIKELRERVAALEAAQKTK